MKAPKSATKIAKAARKSIEKTYRQTIEHEAQKMGRMIGNSFKPKPWWVPMKLWMMGVKIFLNVK